MPTIIEALITTLSLDPSGYLKGQKQTQEASKKTKDETTKSLKEIEAKSKSAVEGFAKLRNEVLGLFAAFTAGVGLQQFIEQTVAADAATGRLAHNLGVSTEELSAWQGVLQRSGGAAADADQGFQTLVDGLQQIKLTGQSPLIPYLNLLKISLKDLESPSDTLLKIADAFHNMDPRQAAAIGKGMGFSPAMVNVLEQGRAAVTGLLAEQQKLGVITQADAEAAQRLQNTLGGLKQAFTGVGRSVLLAFEPAMRVAATALTALGELASKNKPIVIGLFTGLAVAVGLLSIPLLAVTGEMLAFAAPFLLVGAAIALVVEGAIALGHWFMGLVRSNKQLSDAMDAVGAAASGLWSAVKNLFAPLAPIFHTIVGAVEAIGEAISKAFGGASLAVAKTFVGFLTNEFHALADIIRAVTALLHGDLKGAMSAAKDWSQDIFRDQGGAASSSAHTPAAGPRGGAGAPANENGSSASAAATRMIAGFEGFLDHAKWDKNAFRAGFGSDTTTDPRTGAVSRVTPDTKVSREAAAADLNRRVQSEFMPKVAAAVGAAWGKFNNDTKAALTSVAYNYGKLPRDVLAAARAGNLAAISEAIKAHQGDNGGVNARRRLAEAAAVGGARLAANSNASLTAGVAVGARAQYAASGSSSSSRVDIGAINIYPKDSEAKSIAAEIGPEIRKRSFVPQANTGLA